MNIIVVNDGNSKGDLDLPVALSVLEVDLPFDSDLRGRNAGLHLLFLDDDVMLQTDAKTMTGLVQHEWEEAAVDIIGGSVTTDAKSYMRYTGTMEIVEVVST